MAQVLLRYNFQNFALRPGVIKFGEKPLLAYGVGGKKTMHAKRADGCGNINRSFCSSTPHLRLGDLALNIMCKRGLGCNCAKGDSKFDMSLNTIGASDGLAGADLLRESRIAELEMFQELLRRDQIDVEAGDRRSLFQVSQCPGIGKTTLLGLIAKEFPRLLAESRGSSHAIAEGMIGSLVTYNGIHTSRVLTDISIEAALCIRVLHGALACHSAHAGVRCPDLQKFEDIAPLVPKAFAHCKIDVTDTRQVLWKWFGDLPIFVGLDEALKCKDGTEEDSLKLQCLLIAAGAFLDRHDGRNRVYMTVSALSPKRFIRESIASSRKIENIMVFPVERRHGVEMLSVYAKKLKADLNVDSEVLEQLEAIAGGHARAIGMVAKYIAGPSMSRRLSSWDSVRNIFFSLATYLQSCHSYLASCPEPKVLEYLISNPPLIFERHTNLYLEGESKSIEELIFTGQVFVTRGPPLKVTVASWALLSALADSGASLPSTAFLHRACELTHNDKNSTSWFEGFCLFFVAEAMRRGSKALKATIPHLYEADPSFRLSRDQISIEAMTIPNGSPKATVGAELLQQEHAMLVMDRVIELKKICVSAGSKCIILVMPLQFAALDAIIVTHNWVIGIQIKSQIDPSKLLEKISSVRSKLAKWKAAGCDLLGPDGLVMYMVGVDSVSEDLQIMDHERVVMARQLRDHFLDVFFRYGLTGGESKYS